MSRAWIVAAVCMAAGCFSDTESFPCPEGTENCPCLELQCEQGLVCQDSRCLPESSGATGSTSATTSLPSTSTTATTLPTTAGSSTTLPTTGESADSGSTSTTTGMSTDSSSTGSVCGDGVVDDTEMCDGTPGCTDCVFDNYGCNPLNNVPCTEGFKCSMYDDIEGNAATECRVFLEPPPGQLYESNCYNFEPRDDWCDIGLACVTSQSTDACEVNCCVEFCDRLDPTFECNFEGDMCLAAVGDLAPTGMEWLGICITP